jgi:hypothetical protein
VPDLTVPAGHEVAHASALRTNGSLHPEQDVALEHDVHAEEQAAFDQTYRRT